jgi:hypothetical protein
LATQKFVCTFSFFSKNLINQQKQNIKQNPSNKNFNFQINKQVNKCINR